jgi:hypothetical protein
MHSRSSAIDRARAKYKEINWLIAKYPDFQVDELEKSRRFFDLSKPELPTRAFDVVACVVGLPVPASLQRALARMRKEVLKLLPPEVRAYQVGDERLHWEAHRIKGPDESFPSLPLRDISERVVAAVEGVEPFLIHYRGFFISSEGTLCAQGFGETDELRSSLRSFLPFSSRSQSDIAHISLARILDPVGNIKFRELLEARDSSEDEHYGSMLVDRVKLIIERRWYMEDHDVITEVQLRGST